jgi:hypothetical protein
VSDQFAVMHRSVAPIYFNAHKFLERCWKIDDVDVNCDGHHVERPFDSPPECYTAMWLHAHGVDWVGHKVGWGYARE